MLKVVSISAAVGAAALCFISIIILAVEGDPTELGDVVLGTALLGGPAGPWSAS